MRFPLPRSWKTTLAGLALLLTVVSKVAGSGVGSLTGQDWTAVLAGAGLLVAKDANVSGPPTR